MYWKVSRVINLSVGMTLKSLLKQLNKLPKDTTVWLSDINTYASLGGREIEFEWNQKLSKKEEIDFLEGEIQGHEFDIKEQISKTNRMKRRLEALKK